MTCETCAFTTPRLTVRPWHHLTDDERQNRDLADTVAAILTAAVTRSLPTAWQGNFSRHRATTWIAERDREGPTLLAVERASGRPVGLMILVESAAEGAGIDVRLGYVIAEWAWGRGLASELVAGCVAWCRAQPNIRSLAGGVAADNVASRRVLEKNGFRLMADSGAETDTDHLYRLDLRPDE